MEYWIPYSQFYSKRGSMSAGAQLRAGGPFRWNKDKCDSVNCDRYMANVI